MRVADSVTLPNELERARAAGELIVFAGAGVSMGPPANLPDFGGLARMIAEIRVPWSDEYEGKLDQYLGYAERAGVKVQERARRFIADGGSHTPLHEHLLGIFGVAGRVRLITTNFDGCFSAAARAVYPDQPIPHYVGPALPPGQDFSGIAHLHGAVADPHQPLVLTDKDFAAAYMAEGWASRFLVRAFADRTILFVGYSVSDPIMQYLLHALPPTGRWYGLWHDGETVQSDHPIMRVPFSTSATGDRFSELTVGVRRWHWYVSASPSDHDGELRQLIERGPPVSPIDADYIRARLATETGRSVFWAVATDVSWFDWAADEGLLDELTNERGADETTPIWGRWCLANFCSGANPPLLGFLRGRPLALHPLFLGELLHHVWTCKPLPSAPILGQLIALIANPPDSSLAGLAHVDWLLDRLMSEQRHAETFALLRVATRVRLKPIERYFQVLEDAGANERQELRPLAVDVGMMADPRDLESFFQKHGRQLVAINPDRIAALGEERLTEAYELLDLARGDAHTDWLSLGRTAIAPSNQDRLADAEHVLITMIRKVLDHWAATDPDRLRTFAERHDQSARKLFRRLALHAYGRCGTCSADDILARAAAQAWARDAWIRPEFYSLLRDHYPQASETARSNFVRVHRDNHWWDEADGEHAAHVRFSLSRKLLRDAPDSAVTRDFADAESAAHPDWAEGDRDGYLSRAEVGFGGEPPSTIQAAEMLEWPSTEALDRLITALRDLSGRDAGYAIIAAVQQAAASDPRWADGLLVAALEIELEPGVEGIAESVFHGLRDASATATDRIAILEGINGITRAPWTGRLTFALASMLDKWSETLEPPIDPSYLDLLDCTADLIYDCARGQRPSIEHPGWTERALNHPAGYAARIWWRVAIARDRVNDEFVLSLDEAERERWTRVVNDNTASGSFARPVLGMATDRLSAGDLPWAATEIFPAFDVKLRPERAAQLWDGRLRQTRWSWTTLEALQSYHDALFEVSASLIPARSRELGDWVAFLLANREKSGLTLDQLHRFVRAATDKARRTFAEDIPRHVDRLTVDERRALWNSVLRPYWQDRRTNVPRPLAAEELCGMISWVVALPEVADEVLLELQQSPGEQLEHADTQIWKWKEDDAWVRAHPSAAAKLVAFLAARRSIKPLLAEHAVTVLETALEAGAPRDVILRGAESLAALPCPAASRVAQRLRTRE